MLLRWGTPGEEHITFGKKCSTPSEDEGVIWRCVQEKQAGFQWLVLTQLTETERSLVTCRNTIQPNSALIYPMEPGNSRQNSRRKAHGGGVDTSLFFRSPALLCMPLTMQKCTGNAWAFCCQLRTGLIGVLIPAAYRATLAFGILDSLLGLEKLVWAENFPV